MEGVLGRQRCLRNSAGQQTRALFERFWWTAIEPALQVINALLRPPLNIQKYIAQTLHVVVAEVVPIVHHDLDGVVGVAVRFRCVGEMTEEVGDRVETSSKAWPAGASDATGCSRPRYPKTFPRESLFQGDPSTSPRLPRYTPGSLEATPPEGQRASRLVVLGGHNPQAKLAHNRI